MIRQVSIYAEPSCTKIFADGKEIEGGRSFKMEQEVGLELPILKLEIVAREIEFVGESVIEIEKSPT